MNELFHRSQEPEEVARDIIKFKFLTPEGCSIVLTALKAVGGWKPWKHDPVYYTQDIVVKDELPDLYNMLNAKIQNDIYPKVAEFYGVDTYFEIHKMFAIKYSLDTQKSLGLHHDESYISASVKLNEDYDGGILEFPRQEYDNTNIDIGDIILWPGDLTHPHRCTELKSNEKHALTIWSKACTD